MFNKPEAWTIKESEYPQEGSIAEKLAFFVRYAVLAPSTYNSQPWNFSIRGKSVYVFADRRYGLPVIDPEDRELVIACGCTLFNLRLAMRTFGYKDITELLPDRNNPDLMAKVTLGEEAETSSDDKKLFRAICSRHGDRGAFSKREVPEDILRKLKFEASEEGAWLHLPDPVEKELLVRLTAEGDHIQVSQKKFRRELAGWVHQRRMTSKDGLPQEHLSYDDVMNTMGPFAIRRFEMENDRPADDKELNEGSPVIAVLGSKAGGTRERLATGQALQRVWLRAQAEGLSLSTLNQACETPDLRIRLHDEIKHAGRAQIILRIGYGGRPHFTERRPLDQVLEIEGRMMKPGSIRHREKSGVIGRIGNLFLAKNSNK